MKGENSLHDVQLLTAAEVAGLLAVHVRSVWRLASTGELPKPLHVGQSTRWKMADIRAFINDKLEGYQQ